MIWARLPDGSRSKVQGNFSWMDSMRHRHVTILIWNGNFFPVYTLGM